MKKGALTALVLVVLVIGIVGAVLLYSGSSTTGAASSANKVCCKKETPSGPHFEFTNPNGCNDPPKKEPVDPTNCVPPGEPGCNNGQADPGEQCGDPGTAGCAANENCVNCKCQRGPPACANGAIEFGEECNEPGLPGCPVGTDCKKCKCVGPGDKRNPCDNGVFAPENGELCDINANPTGCPAGTKCIGKNGPDGIHSCRCQGEGAATTTTTSSTTSTTSTTTTTAQQTCAEKGFCQVVDNLGCEEGETCVSNGQFGAGGIACGVCTGSSTTSTTTTTEPPSTTSTTEPPSTTSTT